MSAPRYRPVNEGEPGPRYAPAIDWMTRRSHYGGWDPRGQGIALPGVGSSSLLTAFETPGSGDDGVTDRVKPRREFLNRRRLISTCLEAT